MNENTPTIMVVEDETLLLEAIEKRLAQRGLASVSCISGKQALEYLDTLEKMPDAIWLDYRLKDMDGLSFMSQAVEQGKLKNIPVVVVSNTASTDKVKNMLALGAKKYLLKAEHRMDEIIDAILGYINGGKE